MRRIVAVAVHFLNWRACSAAPRIAASDIPPWRCRTGGIIMSSNAALRLDATTHRSAGRYRPGTRPRVRRTCRIGHRRGQVRRRQFRRAESCRAWSRPACPPSLAAAAPASTNSPRCCASSPIIAAPPRWRSPCTPTRSRFRPGAGVPEGGCRSNRCSSVSRPNASSCCRAAARTGSAAPARPRKSTAAIASPRAKCSRPARPPAT